MVLCDNQVANEPELVRVDESDECRPMVVVKHRSGCTLFTFNVFFKMLAFFIIFSGVLLTFMSHAQQILLVQVIVQISAFIIVLPFFITKEYLKKLDPEVPKEVRANMGGTLFFYTILSFAICGGIAMVVGMAFKKYEKMNPIILSAVCWFFAGALIINVVEQVTFDLTRTEDLFGFSGAIIFLVFMTLAGVLFAYRYTLLSMTVCQALASAYLIMRGFTFWYGDYPTEISLVAASLNYEPLELTDAFYEYMQIMVVSAIISFIIQIKFKDHLV
uniref:Uncharacterized protein n=1 Tax=Strombidinopsis acuminata TaxID=141414 RepID=A0A7S3RK25_9SPIT|mmetsp:Transcript_112049/g.154698  ORF Transcript_112049/g.154698 Transcript_112049/m.154698 type:complete len:274 (+) Transcript_112049:692-1513(+)